LESRLQIETAEKVQKVQIESEKKQMIFIAESIREKTQKEAERLIEKDRNDRSLLESRLKIENAEKVQKYWKAQIEGKRLKFESNAKATARVAAGLKEVQIKNERNEKSVLEAKLGERVGISIRRNSSDVYFTLLFTAIVAGSELLRWNSI